MGATGYMVVLFLVAVVVGVFVALWLGYQSVEETRQLEAEAEGGGGEPTRRRSGISSPFSTARTRADVVRRLERHIRSENRLVAAFGSAPSVDRLYGTADGPPRLEDVEAAGSSAS